MLDSRRVAVGPFERGVIADRGGIEDHDVGVVTLSETPATVELLEGSHQTSVVREGFAAWDGTVEAEPNTDQVLPLIQLQPANAKLLVNSIPRSANVTVDGRYRGQSPITLSLAPGVDYTIGLSKAGYGTASRRAGNGSG